MVIDSSGIEMRMMFYIAGQKDKLDLIRTGQDVYTHMAAALYHTSPEQVTKTQRSVGKLQALSLQYGASWKKMQYIFAAGLMGPPIDFSDSEAQHVWSSYRIQNPQVPQYWQACNTMILNMASGIEHTTYIPGTQEPLYTTEFEQLYSHASGLYLYFKDLRQDPAEGWTYKSRTGRAKIYGGMLTGRTVQSAARHTVFHQINQIAQTYPLLLRAHDEAVYLVPNDPDEILKAEVLALKEFSTPPPFMPGLPCSGEVVTAKCYEKPG